MKANYDNPNKSYWKYQGLLSSEVLKVTVLLFIHFNIYITYTV